MAAIKILLSPSFGHRYPEPGASNEAIARHIATVCRSFELVLAQHEIATALRRLGCENVDFEVREHRRVGAYLDTKEVLDQMVTFLRTRHVDLATADVSVLCHPAHWDGVKWLLQKYGISPKRVRAAVPYDRLSHQRWSRYALTTWMYRLWAGFRYLVRRELRF